MTTLYLEPGKKLTVTADAVSSGTVVRLSDSAGGEPYSPVDVSASSSVVLGPYASPRRYALSDALTYVVAVGGQAESSADVRQALSDETGTGAAVFATTPTLVTPKVDTINEATSANGVAIDGVKLKDATVIIGANKVLDAQGALVADASGGVVVDVEARAALNALLARLRAHGIIAT